MSKLRADKFDIIADKKSLMRIQGEAQKYKDDYKVETIKDANMVLNLYAQIAFDEGYRYAFEETMVELKKVYEDGVKKPKKRRKGWFEYIEDGDLKKSFPLVKRRIDSKRQRKEQAKLDEENGREFSEESFTLTMVIHTYFEAGYLKAQTIEEQAKIVCQDQERADLLVQLFGEVFKQIEEVENDKVG